MPAALKLIALHPAAPAKPAYGAPCNGCGVCCAAEPCPVGWLVFRQRSGACPALRWQVADERYVCGLVTAPGDYLRWLPQGWRPAVSRWLAGRIAAGVGCDSDAEVVG